MFIIIQELQNRSSSPGNRRTNVCCMVPEKPADVISEVLKSERFAQIIDCLAAHNILLDQFYHCKKEKVVLTQFGYLSFLPLRHQLFKHSGVPLPALHSNSDQIFQNISRCHGRMLC